MIGDSVGHFAMNVLDKNERAVIIDERIDLAKPVPQRYRGGLGQRRGFYAGSHVDCASYTCFFYKVFSSDSGLYEMDLKLPLGIDATGAVIATSAMSGFVCISGRIGEICLWTDHDLVCSGKN